VNSAAIYCEVVEARHHHGGFTATWLNHYSALNADWEALRDVDFIGVDGTLLQILLDRSGVDIQRTSADLALPEFLGRESTRGARLALIGGVSGIGAKAARRLGQEPVFVSDGFEGLKLLRQNPAALVSANPEIVLVGVGAGLQDRVAVEISQWLPSASVFTVGGWLDQLAAKPQYFPPWVHRMRIGWLWRVAHEPRRLIRRYTVDAFHALTARKDLTGRLSERQLLGGVLLERGGRN
jgi:exopolysaccharide biosynthesis WecB/TagA/CpsF family protein